MLGADAKALPIDHHRTGQRQVFHVSPRHCSQQHSGADVMGRRVVGHVVNIDTEADLCRQMHHGLDVSKRKIDGLTIPDIARLEFDT